MKCDYCNDDVRKTWGKLCNKCLSLEKTYLPDDVRSWCYDEKYEPRIAIMKVSDFNRNFGVLFMNRVSDTNCFFHDYSDEVSVHMNKLAREIPGILDKLNWRKIRDTNGVFKPTIDGVEIKDFIYCHCHDQRYPLIDKFSRIYMTDN